MMFWKNLSELKMLCDLLQIALDHPCDSISEETRETIFCKIRQLLKNLEEEHEQNK